MFKDEYRRQQEGVHADEGLIRRTLTKARAPRQSAPRRALPILAAVVCLLVVLSVPAMLRRPAHTDVTSMNPAVTTTPGLEFTPIGHTTTVDGMTLRYLNSFSTEGSRYIMLSLQGDGVSEEMSLRFALSSEKTGQSYWVGTQQLDHDAGRKLSTFVVAFHEEDLGDYLPMELAADDWHFPSQAYDPATFRMLPEDDRLTLTLLEYNHYFYQPMEALALEELPVLHASSTFSSAKLPDLPGAKLPDLPDSEYRELEMQVEYIGTPDWTEEPLCSPIEGYHIMTARNMDDWLIIETQMDAAYIKPLSEGPVELYAWLYLLPRGVNAHPWQTTGLFENVHASKYQITWKGDESKRRYLQHVFPLEGLDLDKYMLGVYGVYEIDLPDNSSTLTFSLGN